MSNQAKPAANPAASQAGRSSVTSGMAPAGHGSIPHERIAMRAYEKWCTRGCPQGTHEQDWYEAEAELRAESAGKAMPAGSSSSAPMQPPVSARPAPAPSSMPAKPAQRR